MLALGVPGDTVTAIIMGALTLQGLTPGPLLSMNQPLLFKSIIFTVLLANIFMFLYQIVTIKYMAKLIEIPKCYLFPVISVFCIAGVISLNNNVFDLVYLMGFVIIGYILDKNGYPLAPFVLANVLGRIIEDNLRRAIIYYGGFGGCLKQVSIGTVFFILAVVLPIISAILLNSKVREKLKLKPLRRG
jgi:putative tricarboxylic transport membrane protein